MERDGKFKGPAKAVKKQRVKKKCNALTTTKKKNREIMINDLDTQDCTIEELSNGPKDSKPDQSDCIFPSSPGVSMHSVNKNGESSNTDCGKSNIKDKNEPTDVTENDDIANARKVAAFVRKVLHNEIPEEKIQWPLCLLIESKRSVKISQQGFQNMIMEKVAEVMANKSYNAKQIANISVCKEQQLLYYKKYQNLLSRINTMNSDLSLLNRVPDPVTKHVRNVGVSVKMPEKK